MEMNESHLLKIVTNISAKSSLTWSKEKFYLKKYQNILAIDEAGRGALAGPLALGAVLLNGISLEIFEKAQTLPLDSKRLTPLQRKALYYWLKKWGVPHKHIFITHQKIDQKGISQAFIYGLEKLIKLFQPEIIFLDGLKPKKFKKEKRLKAFIKGDARIPSIALASIVAKVNRDRYMERISKKYQGYGFEKHKGYGTKEHLTKIKKLGPCKIHRLSFLSKLLSQKM